MIWRRLRRHWREGRLLEPLIAPFRYSFMQTGLLAVILIGVPAAVIGTYVVLRRMAFIGDALAHTVLPGLVVAYLVGWSLSGGAIVAGVITAVLISWLARRQEIREDTAIGIVFTGMFALGILLISTVRSYRDFTHMLFGNLLGVTVDDLWLMAVITTMVLAALLLFHKELELSSADPIYARVIGIPVDRLTLLLLILLAFCVVTGIQAVGVVLTSALLVTPAAAAALLTHRLVHMMALATIFVVVAGVVGLYASFYFNVSSGAAIVLTCTLIFALTWLVQHVRTTSLINRKG
jgi:manganese/iron transport system permease protein